MKQMKVLQLVSPKLGGIESYVFNHYRYMDREKFHFDFLTQNCVLENAKAYCDLDYKVFHLQKTAEQDRNLFVLRMQEIFSRGYDILHLNNCFWTGFLLEDLAKEAGIQKVIVHAHSSFIDEPDEIKRTDLHRRHEEIKKAFRPDLATDFWACSQIAADWLFGPQIPRDRIRIMKNAIEIDKFQFDPQKRRHIRQKLGVEDNLILGTVGRLSYSKNQIFLIDLFEQFHRKTPQAKLLIIGDGALRNKLTEEICSKGLERDVLLLGWKTDVESYLQAMDVFLLPSRFEGSPISLIEAVAAGLPCVASDQVSKEMAFTKDVRYIPLNIPTWLTTLEEASQPCSNRQEGVEAVRAAGYDIKRQAKVLEELYNA